LWHLRQIVRRRFRNPWNHLWGQMLLIAQLLLDLRPFMEPRQHSHRRLRLDWRCKLQFWLQWHSRRLLHLRRPEQLRRS
jgi:hypothetical protein